MRNYKLYFILMGICALVIVGIIFNALVELNISFLFYVALVLIPLGLLQLLTGLLLLIRLHTYPVWVNQGLSKYWSVIAGYFLVLFAMNHANADMVVLRMIWLFIVPWAIAVYQVHLIWRMAALRKRQLEEGTFLQFY